MITWRPRCLLMLHPANRARYLHNVLWKAYIYICVCIHRCMCIHTHMNRYILYRHIQESLLLLLPAQRAGYLHKVMCKSHIYTHICIHPLIWMYNYNMYIYTVHAHIYVNMHTYIFIYLRGLVCCCVLASRTCMLTCMLLPPRKQVYIYIYIGSLQVNKYVLARTCSK